MSVCVYFQMTFPVAVDESRGEVTQLPPVHYIIQPPLVRPQPRVQRQGISVTPTDFVV